MKLRKVCKTLRTHVDTTEFAFHDFHIHIRFHEVHLDSHNGRFEAFYKQIEEMKFAVSNNIKDGKNDRIFDFDELSNILENDLNIIFANPKRTVHSLTVTVDVNDEPKEELALLDHTAVFQCLNEFLAENGRRLKVRTLNIQFYEYEQVWSILLHLEPGTLKSMILEYSYSGCIASLDYFDEMFQTEQWKAMKEFESYSILFRWEYLADFAHFNRVDMFQVEQFCVDHVERLTEVLLRNPSLDQFSLNTGSWRSDPRRPVDVINHRHNVYNYTKPSEPGWIYFPYPGSDKKLALKIDYEWMIFRGPCYVARDGDDKIIEEDEEDEEEEVGGNDNNAEENPPV
ncbi:hypothetical protein GCK72_011407 [Caenorhabditis remanei]|uniref:DUF38 domain-containing protein n=1 Tax=Caenorhabditis remanei TaxID=31234 RepID=A0A6A5H8F3_CAERE|nr:hypothetical protein GCK72_011407 [Caenorhabditis remanei]KAF1763141.1 hypothetical protein GCK72_011407 [Caenorhabditis remanei]